MATLPMYPICLIYTAIGSPVRGNLPHQTANEVYVIVLPEITYMRLPEQAFCFVYVRARKNWLGADPRLCCWDLIWYITHMELIWELISLRSFLARFSG